MAEKLARSIKRLNSAAVTIPDTDGKLGAGGGNGNDATRPSNIGLSRISSTPHSISMERSKSFFRRMSSVPGSYRTASLLDCVDISMGSLRHSSMQGIPPSVAMTPDIEQKLVRMRNVARSPDSVGIMNKIPTEISEITWDWVRVVLNQYRLTFCDKPAITREAIIDVSIFDCKKSVGDFSSTYQIDVTFEDEEFTDSKGQPLLGSCYENEGEARLLGSGKSIKKCYSFIAKLLPADDPARACVFEANLLEKEIDMNFELLPSLKQFIRLTEIRRQKQDEIKKQPQDKSESSSRSIHSRHTFLDSLTPQCVYSSHNTDGAGVLVFKNSCSDASFKDCSNPEGMSLPEVLEVVKAMAKLHAAGRAFLARNQTQAVKRRYPYLVDDMYSNSSFVQEVNGHLTTYDDFLKTTVQELSSSPTSLTFSLSPNQGVQTTTYAQHSVSEGSLLEARKQFSRILGVDTWQLVQGLCRPGSPNLTTICHGELWERNILLRHIDGKGQSSSSQENNGNVQILDWKNAKIATATLDLAFLLLSSTNSAMRSESTGQILGTYHNVFCQYLSILNPNLQKPSIEELEEDYYHSLEYAILQAICMFVQQMHFYNTLIEDISKGEKFSGPPESSHMASTQQLYKERNVNPAKQVTDANIDSSTGTTDENSTSSEIKSFNESLDKLRTYECRALNLFRDVDITHLQVLNEKLSPTTANLDEVDSLRNRVRTLSGGLAGLQDPDNMALN